MLAICQSIHVIHGGVFCKDAVNTELANTETLLVGGIQG